INRRAWPGVVEQAHPAKRDRRVGRRDPRSAESTAAGGLFVGDGEGGVAGAAVRFDEAAADVLRAGGAAVHLDDTRPWRQAAQIVNPGGQAGPDEGEAELRVFVEQAVSGAEAVQLAEHLRMAEP